MASGRCRARACRKPAGNRESPGRHADGASWRRSAAAEKSERDAEKPPAENRAGGARRSLGESVNCSTIRLVNNAIATSTKKACAKQHAEFQAQCRVKHPEPPGHPTPRATRRAIPAIAPARKPPSPSRQPARRRRVPHPNQTRQQHHAADPREKMSCAFQSAGAAAAKPPMSPQRQSRSTADSAPPAQPTRQRHHQHAHQ